MSYHTPAGFSQSFARLGQQMRSAVSRHFLSPAKVKIEIPGGFPMEAFDARANIFPWSILKLDDVARIVSFWGQKPGDPHSHLDAVHLNSLIFVASMTMDVSPNFYNPDLPKRPVHLETDIDTIGKTSVKIRSEYFVPEYKKPVIKSTRHVVMVDPETRKPMALPQWWIEKFSKYVQPSAKSDRLIIPPLEPKKNIDVAEVEVICLPSDVDPYNHVTASVWIKYCVEAYTLWHIKTFGFTGNGDPFRNLKIMKQVFKGEAGTGDKLMVKFCPSSTNGNEFVFNILKDSTTVHECILEFFPLKHDSNY